MTSICRRCSILLPPASCHCRVSRRCRLESRVIHRQTIPHQNVDPLVQPSSSLSSSSLLESMFVAIGATVVIVVRVDIRRCCRCRSRGYDATANMVINTIRHGTTTNKTAIIIIFVANAVDEKLRIIIIIFFEYIGNY